MNDFTDMFCEMLPINSQLQKPDNQFRKVFDKTVGEYMENQEDIFDGLFLTTATEGWLDAFGQDYGVSRRIDESDEDYRQRIIFEKLEYLTANNLQSMYGLTLYAYVPDYYANRNTLTSDNPYVTSNYIAYASDDLKKILNKKFVIGNGIVWYNDEPLGSITDFYDNDVFLKFYNIFFMDSLENYFEHSEEYYDMNVKLNATSCFNAFKNVGGHSIVLDLPYCTDVREMFYNSTVEEVTLNLPALTSSNQYTDMFKQVAMLKKLNVTLPSNLANGFKTYVLGLNLSRLTSFILNGEEVDLS